MSAAATHWGRRIGRWTRHARHRISAHHQTITLASIITGLFLVIFYFHLTGERGSTTEAEMRWREALQRDLSEVRIPAVPAVPESRNVEYYPIVNKNRTDIFPGADADHMHGVVGVKPDGVPTWMPNKYFDLSRQTRDEKEQAHKGYCFNTEVAKSLDLDRSVPDFQSQQCKNMDYSSIDLPTADVVIVFHGEELSVLLRSVHSILNRTPPNLLESIILVNDASDPETHPWLFHELPYHIQYLPKVKLVHLTKRRGLMMARVEGTKEGSAPAVVYLDSHIEAGRRWLEPLLLPIGRDYRTIVTPRIHTIDAETFEFEHNALSVLSFSWSLGQTHPPNAGNSEFDPEVSPVMAGGLFAASRRWFIDELEGYDPEMRLYGGEEMEIGFKTWQCGGSLYNIPCSHVGHVFRTDKYWKGQVYRVPMDEIVRNKRRVAEVWMDEYLELFDLVASPLPKSNPVGDLSAPRRVREKLQCKSFKWFLDSIVKDMYVPNDVSRSPRGNVGNLLTGMCIDTLQKKGGKIGLFGCHGQHGSQAFLYDPNDKRIRAGSDSFASCIYMSKASDLHMSWCRHTKKGEQDTWDWVPLPDAPNATLTGPSGATKHGQGLMKHIGTGQCLASVKPSKRLGEGGPMYEPSLLACNEQDKSQWWIWELM